MVFAQRYFTPTAEDLQDIFHQANVTTAFIECEHGALLVQVTLLLHLSLHLFDAHCYNYINNLSTDFHDGNRTPIVVVYKF